MNKRELEENIFKGLMILSAIIVVGCFFLIVGTIVVKGLPYLTLDMITKTPDGGFYIGKEGGVFKCHYRVLLYRYWLHNSWAFNQYPCCNLYKSLPEEQFISF